MLDRVRTRRAGHTNASLVAQSRVLSALKLAYYRLFATAYTASLCCADVIWVNSSWTKAHLESLVHHDHDGDGETDALPRRAGPEEVRTNKKTTSRRRKEKGIRLLYPPCDTTHLTSFPLATSGRVSPAQSAQAQVTILSLAQFRPEKEHPTQLRAFAKLLSLLPPPSPSPSRSMPTSSTPSVREGVSPPAPRDLSPSRDQLHLVLAGSVRGAADSARVETLRRLATELGIADQVEFVVNASYPVICEWMERATIGLHTMIDEHFGITVVEFQVGSRLSLPLSLRSLPIDPLVCCVKRSCVNACACTRAPETDTCTLSAIRPPGSFPWPMLRPDR